MAFLDRAAAPARRPGLSGCCGVLGEVDSAAPSVTAAVQQRLASLNQAAARMTDWESGFFPWLSAQTPSDADENYGFTLATLLLAAYNATAAQGGVRVLGVTTTRARGDGEAAETAAQGIDAAARSAAQGGFPKASAALSEAAAYVRGIKTDAEFRPWDGSYQSKNPADQPWAESQTAKALPILQATLSAVTAWFLDVASMGAGAQRLVVLASAGQAELAGKVAVKSAETAKFLTDAEVVTQNGVCGSLLNMVEHPIDYAVNCTALGYLKYVIYAGGALALWKSYRWLRR